MGKSFHQDGVMVDLCNLPLPKPYSNKFGTLRVALGQITSVFGNKTANFAAMQQQAKVAAANGAELITFPELTSTGYREFSNSERDSLIEAANGSFYQQVQHLADELDIHIIYGFMEDGSPPPSGRGVRAPNDFAMYDAANLVTPGQKAPTGTHRKTSLSGDWEIASFDQGQDYSVFRVKNFTVGILICAEISMPEAARVLALKGAQVIMIPTAQLSPPAMNGYSNMSVPQRANENGIFVGYSNWYLPAGVPGAMAPVQGLSRVSDALFNTLVRGVSWGEHLVITDTFPQILPHYDCELIYGQRRPELYGSLTDPSATEHLCHDIIGDDDDDFFNQRG